MVGEFIIVETNERIKVSGTESFNITLPKRGKYEFGFFTNDFTAYTDYPSRITERKNTITIRLMEKNLVTFPMNLETNLTDEQIEQRIADGTLNFIINGIDNTIPDGYVQFREKYGIGVIKENCVIDPYTFKNTRENNQMICVYLNKKYGEDWLKELSTKPFGIK